jgi:microcystin-dependent protein
MTPYLGQIEIFAFGFAPKGWQLCRGQMLSIAQYQALYSLLGTTYGGDGRINFALPNMDGCVPIGVSTDYELGEKGGEVTHTLMSECVPAHAHPVNVDANPGTIDTPAANTVLAAGTGSHAGGAAFAIDNYTTVTSTPENPKTLALQSVSTVGGQAHNNLQPYLKLNFCIAMEGYYPSAA